MFEEIFNRGQIEYISGEDWKPFGNYLVSSFGRVYSLYRNKMLRPILKKSESKYYYSVTLSVDGVLTRYRLHRLIAMLFIPNPEQKAEVHHKDCNSLNNRADNLMWVTSKEHNEIHRKLRQKGSEQR